MDLSEKTQEILKKSDPLIIASEQDIQKLRIRAEEHKQTMGERQQRQKIGWFLAPIVIIFPIILLVLLWYFINNRLSIETEIPTLVIFMFSSTYIAIVALYGGIIAAVFRKIGDAKTDDSTSDKNDKL